MSKQHQDQLQACIGDDEAPFEGRILVVGAGAVGGFVGGKLAAAGHDVTFIDAWKEHVEAINRQGLMLSEPGKEIQVRVPAFHVDDVPCLPLASFDLVFICLKLYDTDWAVRLVVPLLSDKGCVVTLQNSLVEGVVAAHVGWDRTLGCIGSGMYVALVEPGHVHRSKLARSEERRVGKEGGARGGV